MQIYSPDTNSSIVTLFPEDKFNLILNTLAIPIDPAKEDVKAFTIEQLQNILILAIHLFLKGTLYLEELSDIANYLLTYFTGKNRTETKEEKDLFDVFLGVAELSYYIRSNSDSSLNTFRKRMFDFYEKNKDRVPAELQSKDPEWKPEFLEDRN